MEFREGHEDEVINFAGVVCTQQNPRINFDSPSFFEHFLVYAEGFNNSASVTFPLRS